jgi:hypothetical protein
MAAVLSRWIQLPSSPIVLERSEPLLAEEARLEEVVEFAQTDGATLVTVDIASSTDSRAVIDGMKAVLRFPDWCGSSWDSIEDAFEELRQAWSFPLVLVVRGLRRVLEDRPHLGLQVVIRLSQLALRAFKSWASCFSRRPSMTDRTTGGG